MTSHRLLLIWLSFLTLQPFSVGGSQEPPPPDSPPPPAPPEDVTEATRNHRERRARLETAGRIVFREDFEQEDALGAWFNLLGIDEGRTQLVFDEQIAHRGRGALQLTTIDRDGESCGAGASHWIAEGHDVLYFRRYVRFAADYDQGNLNHVGGSLYAIASSNRWAEMGKAGIKPKGDDRFGASFEPWRAWGRHEPPGSMMLYTYWMDMARDRDGHYWGNNLAPAPERQRTLERDRWICLEHMIRANTPGKADGELAAWIDGTLYLHLIGFRWRSADAVRLKRIGLGLYVHQSRHTNHVWYDDVVVSTGYVGPEPEAGKKKSP